MVKTAKPGSSANRSSVNTEQPKKDVSPKSQFIGSALSMSWQLAAAVLIPVIGGYKLDQHFNTLPLWTFVGFVIAMVVSFFIIKGVLDQFNEDVIDKAKK